MAGIESVLLPLFSMQHVSLPPLRSKLAPHLCGRFTYCKIITWKIADAECIAHLFGSLPLSLPLAAFAVTNLHGLIIFHVCLDEPYLISIPKA